MYTEKFDIIKSFTISQIILGTGYGSDLIVSEIWWWGERGSHNDFLTFFIENGVIFLLLYAALLKDIYIMLKNNTQKILFLSIIFTSCVSNGFLSRSISLYLIIFIIICLKNYNLKNNTKIS